MEQLLTCADCGTTNTRADRADGWHSVITDDLGSRVTCDSCYRWRSQRGYVFDPRPLSQIVGPPRDEVVGLGVRREGR